MKRGQMANAAVDEAISRISAARLSHPSYLDHIVFAFPRVLTDFAGDKWSGGSVFLAAAATIARNPENRVNKGVPLRWYDEKHSIPSVIIPLNGVRDVEYHVSRRNIERLLSVGCIVFQKYPRGFGVRIPSSSPMLTGQPYSFNVEEEARDHQLNKGERSS